MSIYRPYTYLIGWSDQNKWYYGVRFSRNSNTAELFQTYFTSSKHVKEMVKTYDHPNVIQIRKTFDSVEKARLWENKVLRRMKVIDDNKWINKTDNISISVEQSMIGSKKKNFRY
jgi:hypothetical protein